MSSITLTNVAPATLYYHQRCSLETLALVSRLLRDKKGGLGLGLGEKVLTFLRP